MKKILFVYSFQLGHSKNSSETQLEICLNQYSSECDICAFKSVETASMAHVVKQC